MNTQASRSWYLPRMIVGIAVILFSTAGIAAILGWFPASPDVSADGPALDNFPAADTGQTASMQMEDAARAKRRCAECGVIVSTREILRHDEGLDSGAAGGVTAENRDEARGTATTSHAIVIRAADGSGRLINHTSPADWRPGERVIVIDGANSSKR